MMLKLPKPSNNREQRNQTYLVWSLLVIFNAAFSLVMAATMIQHLAVYLGIIAGTGTFILLYAELELFCRSSGYTVLVRQLRLSALLKPLTFLFPVIELFTGYFAITTVHLLTGVHIDHRQEDLIGSAISLPALKFVTAYLTTILQGLLLSIVVSVLLVMIRLIAGLRAVKHKNA